MDNPAFESQNHQHPNPLMGNNPPDPSPTTSPTSDPGFTHDSTPDPTPAPISSAPAAPSTSPSSPVPASSSTSPSAFASAPAPRPAATPIPGSAPQPITHGEQQPVNNPASQSAGPQPKKKKTGLIIGIVVAAVLLLGSIGAFTALAIIKNQPEIMLGESINNLINAKQIAIDGTIEYNRIYDAVPTENCSDVYVDCVESYHAGPLDYLDISSMKLTLGTEFAATGQSDSSAGLQITFSDDTTISLAMAGETTIIDGALYIKVGGLQGIYEASTRNASEAELPSEVNTMMNDLIGLFDNQWIKISLDEILDHELITDAITSSDKQRFRKTYDCAMSRPYSQDEANKELYDIYTKNSFVKITPSAPTTPASSGPFYDVSIDWYKLVDFDNAFLDSKIHNAFESCIDADYDNTTVQKATYPSRADVEAIENSMPKILVKFDGFLNHRLSELKFDDTGSDYTTSYDFKFYYPDSIMTSNPTNARPIMDIIVDMTEKINELSAFYAPQYSYDDYYNYDIYDYGDDDDNDDEDYDNLTEEEWEELLDKLNDLDI